MKKNLKPIGAWDSYALKKTGRIMRCILILLFASTLNLMATVSFSQKTKISLARKAASLESVMEEIEKQSDYVFLFSKEVIDINRSVEINARDLAVEEVLSELFQSGNIEYRIIDNKIILSARSKVSVVQQEQQIKVTGQVTDNKGEPLPGVNVFEKTNSTNGVITGVDGSYTITLSGPEAILTFSFIGFVSQEVNVAGRQQINITLLEEYMDIDEVVVVGYGTQRKEALTSAVSKVGTDKIESVSVTSVEKALQGNAAGVVVTTPVGQPGSFASVQIRGLGSISASNQPLYVVDGVPVITGQSSSWAPSNASNFLSSLNPSDIESMTVMKDAAATAIYGSRASNGVVIITTKRGKEGKTNINFNMEAGISDVTNTSIRMVNSKELLELQRESVDNARDYFGMAEYDWTDPNGDYYLPDELANNNTNWWDEVTQQGRYQSYDISLNGGNEKTKFFASASWFDQEGTIIGTGFDRFSGRINLEHQINDRISLGINTSASTSHQEYTIAGWAWENPVAASFWIVPYVSPYNADGSYNWDLMGSNGNYNPVANNNLNERGNKTISFMNTSYLKIDILKDLYFKTTLGVDWKNVRERQYISPQTLYGQELDGGVYGQEDKYYNWTSSNTLNYNKILKERHSLGAMVGYEVNAFKNNWLYAGGGGANDDIPYLDAVSKNQEVGESIVENSSISMFGRLDYSFDSRYYLSASMRRDGSSKFGTNNKWANFGSVSLAWTVTQEEFFNVPFIDLLKLRASYGTTGNSSIGNYASKGLYQTVIYAKSGGLLPKQIEQPDLRWESAATMNVGVDFGFFNRISGSAEYFWRTTYDLLLEDELSYTSGQGSVTRNMGEMLHKGLELQLSTQNVKGDFAWNTDFNISLPTSEVKDLGGPDFVSNGSYQRRRVGHSFSEWYMYDYAGVDPGNGLAMWYDERGNITYNQVDARRVYCGSPEPELYGGLTNTLEYKGVSLSFMFYFLYGNEVMYSERIYTEHDGSGTLSDPVNSNQLDRWQKPGDITDVPKPIYDNATNSNTWVSNRWLEDGSYLRLKNVTLSYSLPKRWLDKVRISNLKVFAKGTNLWTLSNVSALDPEIGAYGYSYNAYPNPRTIVLGVNVGL